MIGMRIAVQTLSTAQPFRKALHTVAQTGCEGVQIDARNELRPADLSDTGLRQVRKMLADLNLRVGSVAFPTHRGYSDPQDLERRVDATRAAMRLAAQLQARILVCTLGELGSNPESRERSMLTDVITALSAEGDRCGVRLALRIGAEELQDVSDYLETLPEGSFGVDLHPLQCMTHGNSPQDFVSILGKHLVHVHAVDAVRDLSGGGCMEVTLGRGSVDFPELLGKLEEFGYRDWLTLERRHSAQVLEDMANAVKYLRAL